MRIFLTFKTDSDSSSVTVIVELFNDKYPISVSKFHKFCSSSSTITYKGAMISRVISPEFIIQGGTLKDGPADLTIFDKGEFDKFNTEFQYGKKGLLAIATNDDAVKSTEFFITLADNLSSLNYNYTIIGRVVKNLNYLIEWSSCIKVDDRDRPIDKVYIETCGELVKKEKKANTNDEVSSSLNEEKIKTFNESKDVEEKSSPQIHRHHHHRHRHNRQVDSDSHDHDRSRHYQSSSRRHNEDGSTHHSSDKMINKEKRDYKDIDRRSIRAKYNDHE